MDVVHVLLHLKYVLHLVQQTDSKVLHMCIVWEHFLVFGHSHLATRNAHTVCCKSGTCIGASLV